MEYADPNDFEPIAQSVAVTDPNDFEVIAEQANPADFEIVQPVNTGDYTISSAKAAPTNAVPILQPVDGQWTPEAIAAHNAGADELNPPTENALRERSYNEALTPFFQESQGPRRLTEAELRASQTPRVEAFEPKTFTGEIGKGNIPGAIGVAYKAARESLTGILPPTEGQILNESVPWGTNPDGSVKYEYKPLGSRLDKTGIMTPLLETQMMSPEAGDSTMSAIGKSTFNFMAGLVNFGLSPLGIATVGLGAGTGAATRAAGFAPAGLGAEGSVAAETAARLAATARVVSGGFAIDMASAVPEQYKAATESPTLQGRIEGWLGTVSSLGFAALAAKHAAKKPLELAERQTIESVVELAKRTPDAVLETVSRNMEVDVYSRNLAIAELQRRQTERQAALAPEAAAAAEAAGTALPSGTAGPPAKPNAYDGIDSQAIQDALDGKNGTIPNPTDRAAAITELERRKAKDTAAKAAEPPDPAATAVGVIKTAAAADAAGKPFSPRIEEPGTPTPYGRETDVFDITTGLQRKPAPAAKAGEGGAKVREASDMTQEQRQEQAELLRDMMASNRELKKPIPQGWVNRLAELEGAPKAQEGEIYANIVEGHPQHEVSSAELRNLIPIKITKSSDLRGKLDQSQALFDKWATLIGRAEYAVKTAKTPALKKKAQAALSKLGSEKDAFETLKSTIIPELNRLNNEALKREETNPTPAAPAAPKVAPPVAPKPESVVSPKPKGPEPTIQQSLNEALEVSGDLPSAWENLDNQVKALENNETNKAAIKRLNAAKRKIENTLEEEYRRAEIEQLEVEQNKGYELLSSIKQLGGLPTLGEKGRYATGELKRIAEASKGAFLSFFRKGAKSLDQLRESLNERGFDFETPEQMLMAIEDSLATNKKQYGSQFPEGYTGGPGAMGPVEAAYMEASRKIFQSAQEPIQQRRVEEQRGEREEWLRRSDPDRMAEAEAIMERDPQAGQKLVDSINAGETKSATDIQELILARELIDQYAARDAAAERLADPDPTIPPTERAFFEKEFNAANERIGKTEDASDKTGSEKGAGFRMRRMMIADDYSLQGLSRRERKMKGRDLTPEEIEALRKESNAIKKKQEEIDSVVEKENKEMEEAAVDSVLAAAIADREAQKSAAQRSGALPYNQKVLEQAERIVSKWEEEAVGAAERLKDFFGSEAGSVGGVGGPKGSGRYLSGKSKKPGYSNRAEENSRINDLAVVICAKIGRFSLDRTKTLETLLVQFGDGVRPYFDKAWKAAQKIIGAEVASKPTKVKEAIKTGATAPEKQPKPPKPPKSKDTLVGEGRAAVEKGEGLHNVVAQIVDGMIDAGNRDRADIFKRTTKIVQEFMPEATERDVNRAYVDYGKKSYPNPDEAAAFKRKTRQVKKIGEDIDRLKEKMRPELQGYQREKLDLELRDLVKQRSELLKDPTLPQEPGAFASKDEAKQTRIKNRIEELDRYLKTGEKPVEGKPTQPDSAITEQLRAEKEALEAYVKEVDAAKNPPLSDAQKALDAAMIARERAGQTLDDISTGKVKDPVKVKEALTQLEEDVRLETDALKALAAEMRRDAKPKGDPGYLKEQAQIKALERAIASYEKRVANADFAAKGKVQGPDSQRVTQLKAIRDLRRAAYKAAKDAGKPVRSPEDRYNDTRLNAMKRREEDLKARATRQAAGDFSKKPKPVTPALRRDVLNKKAELQNMKDEIDMRQKQYELSRRPAWKKIASGLGEARGIILGGDLGVLTRQGLFAWSRPGQAFVSTAKAFQSMFSPEAMRRWEVEMREKEINGKPLAPIRKEAGLQTTDTMNNREELAISRLLSRMPDIKVGGKTIKLSVAAKGLERFQTTFINDVRMRTFDSAVKRGFTPEELKLRANFINSSSGRSNAKFVPEELAAIMTSPRYERSRWEMLAQPIRNVGALARSGVKGELNRAAAANLQDMAVTAAGAITLFQLAKMAGYTVNFDPESSDFLKMRKGNEVWDVTSGLAPRIRDLMRLWVGFTNPDYKENWMKTSGKMIFRTINPAIKTPLEQLSIAGQRMAGKDDPKSPFTGFKSVEEREGLITLAPLIIQSMKQAYEEDGVEAAVFTGAREFVGSSVGRYPESKNDR